MKFIAVKGTEQLDLQALHRVREKLVSQRAAVIDQFRDILLERGLAVRQGALALRRELPDFLAKHTDVLSLRMLHTIEEPADDRRCLDRRIEHTSITIEAIGQQPAATRSSRSRRTCERLAR